MKKVSLSGKKGKDLFTLVDNNIYKKVNKYKWHLDSHGYATTTVYLGGGRKNQINKHLPLHRLIMDFPKNLQIDHINRNRLDNRKVNLRTCTKKENLQNSSKRLGTTSIYKGVSLSKNGWMVQVAGSFGGYFPTEIMAGMAYDIQAKDKFGKFAKLNF